MDKFRCSHQSYQTQYTQHKPSPSLNQELNKIGRIRNLTLGKKCNFEKLGSKNVIWKKFRGPFVILKGFS